MASPTIVGVSPDRTATSAIAGSVSGGATQLMRRFSHQIARSEMAQPPYYASRDPTEVEEASVDRAHRMAALKKDDAAAGGN